MTHIEHADKKFITWKVLNWLTGEWINERDKHEHQYFSSRLLTEIKGATWFIGKIRNTLVYVFFTAIFDFQFWNRTRITGFGTLISERSVLTKYNINNGEISEN